MKSQQNSLNFHGTMDGVNVDRSSGHGIELLRLQFHYILLFFFTNLSIWYLIYFLQWI